MRRLRFAVFALATATCLAQLTPDQKTSDFRYLASLYAKQYAPYEWKRAVFGFDLFQIGPWLQRVAQTKDDLDFYELCVEYVASLNDTHDSFILPSDFVASLGFTVDIYDGVVMIDTINRTLLPQSRLPFGVGDEVVSLDGKDAAQLLDEFAKYARQGNPRSTRRVAAARIVTRPQSRMPHAPDVGDSATVVIRRQNGALETYTVPWFKTGTPLRVGPVLSPRSARPRSALLEDEEPVPDYMRALMEVQYSGTSEPYGVLNYGSRTPIFALPDGFVQRLGRVPADFFYSGTYRSGGFNIGYIRIPNYGSLSTVVLQQFEQEIAFFQQNTDGLVVDEMRNTGGFLCFGENIVARLTSRNFRPIGYLLRATQSRLNSFFNSLNAARAQGADQWVIDVYEAMFKEMQQAFSENRGLTGPLPLCGPTMDRQTAMDQRGNSIAYTKPLVVVIDEFSTSTADSVPGMLQDAGRGILFGMRTNGAGGTNTGFDTGAYSEGIAGMTLGLMTRQNPIATPEYPTAPLIENIGVQPDIEVDYMTRDNLLQRGKPFVDGFSAAIVNAIRAGR